MKFFNGRTTECIKSFDSNLRLSVRASNRWSPTWRRLERGISMKSKLFSGHPVQEKLSSRTLSFSLAVLLESNCFIPKPIRILLAETLNFKSNMNRRVRSSRPFQKSPLPRSARGLTLEALTRRCF